jgi:hypothetical protein
MPEATTTAAGVVRAPAERVYALLADYRYHHPRIVPPEYFTALQVEQGGRGAGTRVRVRMRVMGVARESIHVIREPEPGRVLEELDSEGATATTFTVDPFRDGTESRVTIRTRFRVRPGVRGMIERVLTGMLLRRIYRKELVRLDEYARSRAAVAV